MDEETEWLTQAENCSGQLSIFNSHDQENQPDEFLRDFFESLDSLERKKEYFSDLDRLRRMSNEPIKEKIIWPMEVDDNGQGFRA